MDDTSFESFKNNTPPVGYYVVRFQIKSESNQGWDDDTALNGLNLFCNSKISISSKVGPWGSWSRWTNYCKGGYTKVQINYDNKVINQN